ncbi:MAG: ParB/RepB/Spo0J family partition protein [Betaproteobacteria bacterium]|jgi:ParB family chromosome partitioning protein|nr:ParB/RepB/Spo0J family partition protein [Betaproteobacteria bacterium]
MVKAKGLGRGLDALFLNANSDSGESVIQNPMVLPINALQAGKFQPRTLIDDGAIAELSESIRSQGVIQPLIVRSLANGQYEIIAGERRWRAAKKAGLEVVPVVLKEADDQSVMAMALIENIQREDLNAIDEALGIRRLTDEFKMTHESVAKILGKSRSAVTNLLRLLSLPSMVQQLLREKKLEMGHARSLLAAQESRQGDLAKRIVALNLTVRESESLVASVNKKTSDPRKNKSNADTDTMNLEDQLSQKLGMSVKIKNTKAGSGKVILSYRNLDDLDVLLAKLRA